MVVLNPEYTVSFCTPRHGFYNKPTVDDVTYMRWFVNTGNEVVPHSATHSSICRDYTNFFGVSATGTNPRLSIAGTRTGDSSTWSVTLTITINGSSTNWNLMAPYSTGASKLSYFNNRINGMSLGDGVVTTTTDFNHVTISAATAALADVSNLDISTTKYLQMDPDAFYRIEVTENIADIQAYIRTGMDRNGANDTGAGPATGLAAKYIPTAWASPYGVGQPKMFQAVVASGVKIASYTMDSEIYVMDGKNGGAPINLFNIPYFVGGLTDTDKLRWLNATLGTGWGIWLEHKQLDYGGTIAGLKSLLQSTGAHVTSFSGLYAFAAYSGLYTVNSTNATYIGP